MWVWFKGVRAGSHGIVERVDGGGMDVSRGGMLVAVKVVIYGLMFLRKGVRV